MLKEHVADLIHSIDRGDLVEAIERSQPAQWQTSDELANLSEVAVSYVNTHIAVAHEALLQNLPNGGAVVAIIVVVWFFLSRQDKSDGHMETIVTRFTQELAQARKDYLDHLKELTQKNRPK